MLRSLAAIDLWPSPRADQFEMMKTLVQCDFDGTITEDDASFHLLDAHSCDDWRRLLQDYRERRMSVLDFNTRAFATVKADRPALLDTLKDKVKVRYGFRGFVDYCLARGFRFVIVSNGLDFYIDATMRDLGLANAEVYAARTSFGPEGIQVRYTAPDGQPLDDGFKEAYIRLFLKQGYRVVYMGNGESDIPAARQAHHVFATGQLLSYYRENFLDCRPLENFSDAAKDLDEMLEIQV